MYKLVVSDDVAFTARFVLNDAGEDKEFGAKFRARRCPGAKLDELFRTAGLLATDLLKGQGLTLVGWAGAAPLVDEATGQAAPADADAQEALMALTGMPNVVLAAYTHANSAQAKLGN